MPNHHPKPQWTEELTAEIKRLRTALQEVAAIENKHFGDDWEEIEEARGIATAALQHS